MIQSDKIKRNKNGISITGLKNQELFEALELLLNEAAKEHKGKYYKIIQGKWDEEYGDVYPDAFIALRFGK